MVKVSENNYKIDCLTIACHIATPLQFGFQGASENQPCLKFGCLNVSACR
jgi:hypothetical protein